MPFVINDATSHERNGAKNIRREVEKKFLVGASKHGRSGLSKQRPFFSLALSFFFFFVRGCVCNSYTACLV